VTSHSREPNQDRALTRANGSELITAERQRQVDIEGWTTEHDEQHKGDGLAWAAVCYAAPERVYRRSLRISGGEHYTDPWPWDWRYDKRHPRCDHTPSVRTGPGVASTETRIRELVKAGALIAAEIDRLQAASDDS
jgi:hypothetical protein